MPSRIDNQLPTPQEAQSPFFFSNNRLSDTPLLPPSPLNFNNHFTSWTPVDAMTPISTNPSRKRSRDETAFENEMDNSYFPAPQVNTPAPILEEPVYGEGMVLLNPQTGISVSAESQTGTWFEEKVETESRNPPAADSDFRPTMPTRKSVRIDSTAPVPRLDDIAATVAPSSPSKTPQDQPEVDNFTLALGIGWTGLASEDPDSQAAARGWARYIENHYSSSVHGPEVLSKSKGLNAYLVGCCEGFFLFSDDLSEGRMVSRNWDTCVSNLRAHPTTYEGQETLKAERSPGPEGMSINGVNTTSALAASSVSYSNGITRHANVSRDGMDLD